MSMEGLLKMHGVDAPRFISAKGGLSIGTLASGFRITPHTFHGGEEAVDLTPDVWWRDRDSRARDREAMRTWFPDFAEFEPQEDTPPAWVGTIDVGYGLRKIGVVNRGDHGLP